MPGDMNIDEEDLGGYKLSEDVEITIGEGDTKLSVLLDKVIYRKVIINFVHEPSSDDAWHVNLFC